MATFLLCLWSSLSITWMPLGSESRASMEARDLESDGMGWWETRLDRCIRALNAKPRASAFSCQ